MGKMNIIKVEKTKNYVVMSNQHLHVLNMSLRAKGLLCEILSLPPDWDYSTSGLSSINKESRTVIKSTLDELKELGYLKVVKKPPIAKELGGTGRYEYEYTIYENSITPEKLKFSWNK